MAKTRRPGSAFDSTLTTLVGTDFVQQLTNPDNDHAPLRIGKGKSARRWSSQELALRLGVVNTRAARMLTKAADDAGATSVRDLYDNSTPYTFALKGIGRTVLYVLWRLFESEGLDPDQWATAGDTEAALVAFTTLKKREAAGEARTKAAERKRTATARRQIHEGDVDSVLGVKPHAKAADRRR